MPFAYVGSIPGNLASGRPLVFGDEVDAAELAPEDQRLPLVQVGDSQPVTPAPAPEATEPSTSTPEAE